MTDNYFRHIYNDKLEIYEFTTNTVEILPHGKLFS